MTRLTTRIGGLLTTALGVNGRLFSLYWLLPNFAAIVVSALVTALAAGKPAVSAEYLGLRSGSGPALLGFFEHWQTWQALVAAHLVLCVALAAWAWRRIRDTVTNASHFRTRVIAILALSIGGAALLAYFVRIHDVIYPDAYKVLLAAHVMPNFPIGSLDGLTASRIELWAVFAGTLLAGNFGIFVLITVISPGKEDDLRTLRRKFRALRTFTYLTSSMFVLVTLIVFLWANFPGWQMDWTRAQALQGPPPGKASKSVSAPSARYVPEDPKWQRQFEYERARYASAASGFVTTFAVVYTMLLLFYYFVPKGFLDDRAYDLWQVRPESEKAIGFGAWQESSLAASWFDRLKSGLAVIAPLLASPLADLGASVLK